MDAATAPSEWPVASDQWPVAGGRWPVASGQARDRWRLRNDRPPSACYTTESRSAHDVDFVERSEWQRLLDDARPIWKRLQRPPTSRWTQLPARADVTRSVAVPVFGLAVGIFCVAPAGVVTRSAWQDEGHVLVNRVAAQHLPEEIPRFFRDAVERLAYLGPEPDRWRRESELTLKASQEPDHFIKLELVGNLSSVRSRYEFYRMLYERRADPAAPGAVPADSLLPEHVGLLPYMTIEVYERLKVAIREYRALERAGEPTELVEGNIILYAGWLGHYAADGAQPHHASIHYDGWQGPNPQGYAGPGIHARFEGDFVRGGGIRAEDICARVGPPAHLDDPFADFLSFLNESQRLIEETYEIDKAGGFSGAGTERAREFTLVRLAAASQLLLDLWYTAWDG